MNDIILLNVNKKRKVFLFKTLFLIENVEKIKDRNCECDHY